VVFKLLPDNFILVFFVKLSLVEFFSCMNTEKTLLQEECITTRYTKYSYKIKYLYSVAFKRKVVHCKLNTNLFSVSVIFHIPDIYMRCKFYVCFYIALSIEIPIYMRACPELTCLTNRVCGRIHNATNIFYYFLRRYTRVVL
jgi:hypothetical protein